MVDDDTVEMVAKIFLMYARRIVPQTLGWAFCVFLLIQRKHFKFSWSSKQLYLGERVNAAFPKLPKGSYGPCSCPRPQVSGRGRSHQEASVCRGAGRGDSPPTAPSGLGLPRTLTNVWTTGHKVEGNREFLGMGIEVYFLVPKQSRRVAIFCLLFFFKCFPV